MATFTGYIPDHLRTKTDAQLWHFRDSMLMVMKRLLPEAWTSDEAHRVCRRCQLEIAEVDALLHKRWMKLSPTFRKGQSQ